MSTSPCPCVHLSLRVPISAHIPMSLHVPVSPVSMRILVSPPQILESTVENARTVLQIDNARLAADDFRVKFEAELAIRLSVDSDIAGLRKVLDDTNMTRLQLEGDIEALREELILLRKDHDQEVQDLRAQASQSALTVEVDAPRSQDLGKVLGELRAQYDALAQKNLEDLEKQWGQQITETTLEVTQSTKDLDTARGTVGALRRSLQTLEIDLEALRNQVPSNPPKNPNPPKIPQSTVSHPQLPPQKN
uniref:Keratin 18 n=1 Tax=Zosterops lateralis melanops TaxID=1220523 RepID=A0A8D2P382_ZOSLA